MFATSEFPAEIPRTQTYNYSYTKPLGHIKKMNFPKIGLMDTINIEQLRKDYDLPPFRDYYNSMTINHFEMNKQAMLDRGITEPKLYN